MLNTLVLNAAIENNWPAVDQYLAENQQSYAPSIDLTFNALHAASENNWFIVFLCLDIHKRSPIPVINLQATILFNGEQNRIFDFAMGRTFWDQQGKPIQIDLFLKAHFNLDRSYDLEVLRAGRQGQWDTVFKLLQLSNAFSSTPIDLGIRDHCHPEGFRLFDYAEDQHNIPVILELFKLNLAKPSYDIKLFKAAGTGDWDTVLHLLDQGLVNINLQNALHPYRWTVIDYANAQNNIEAMKGLMLRTPKAMMVDQAPPVALCNSRTFLPSRNNTTTTDIKSPRPIRRSVSLASLLLKENTESEENKTKLSLSI